MTIVATHVSLYRSLAAAELLAAEGIECEVIDPLTLNPLDERDDLRVGQARPAGS